MSLRRNGSFFQLHTLSAIVFIRFESIPIAFWILFVWSSGLSFSHRGENASHFVRSNSSMKIAVNGTFPRSKNVPFKTICSRIPEGNLSSVKSSHTLCTRSWNPLSAKTLSTISIPISSPIFTVFSVFPGHFFSTPNVSASFCCTEKDLSQRFVFANSSSFSGESAHFFLAASRAISYSASFSCTFSGFVASLRMSFSCCSFESLSKPLFFSFTIFFVDSLDTSDNESKVID